MRKITKRFGDRAANSEVDLTVRPRSIHAIVGENGAGKSTVVKILYGMYAPDSGSVSVNGRPAKISNSRDAIKLGIGMVHQHFMQIPDMTVAENIALGYESVSTFGALRLDETERKISEIAARFNICVDPREKVGNLSVGRQQRVEIIKALCRDAEILILDEPTAVLTPLEVKAFFATLRELKAAGKTIILITHKLNEVMNLADRVTIMRDGGKVGDLEISEADEETMARMMVGRELSPPKPSPPAGTRAEVLRVENLCAAEGKLDGISLSIRAGEILGIAGVSGNGQTELEFALAGLIPTSGGEIYFNGQRYFPDPKRNRANGIAHVPSDREKLGYVRGFPNYDNLVLGYHGRPEYCRASGFRKMEAVLAAAAERIRSYRVSPPDPALPTSSLSGGNKQKWVAAREFEQNPELLIIAEPTRGVDIGSIEWLHEKILELRQRGTAVLLISAELEEIRVLADRSLVLYGGRVSGTFDGGDFDETRVALMMTGNREKGEAVGA